MTSSDLTRPVEILLVEDNPDDALLTEEALQEAKVWSNLSVTVDGVEAMDFLRRHGKFANAPTPDIMFLDLNLPRMDGREVLAEVKGDDQLKHLPIVILTTSGAEQDILRSYRLHANCYVTKPVDLEQFIKIVQSIEEFWFTVVKLPRV